MDPSRNCKQILIVEDDDGILVTLQELLSQEGYTVLLARNGQEALQTLATLTRPCLILLDMFMPVMDGWQFLEQMKLEKEDLLTNIPIVITSAAGERAKVASKEVRGFIKKPIHLEDLLTTVRKFCGEPPSQRSIAG